LRAGKGWVYEGGIRVPLIIRYPGEVRAGVTSAEPVVSTDFYPTILDMAGLPLRPEQHLDGLSLKPLLTGNASSLDRDALYFHFPHYHPINTMGPAGAVRARDYKLVEVFETGRTELYNLREDIGETKDLAAEKPELAAKLEKMLRDWRTSSGSIMPEANPAYEAEHGYRGTAKPPAAATNVAAHGAKNPDFYTPPQDREGLKPNTDLKAGLPNVLLIGDSISLGYTKQVTELLKDVANVQRPPDNCGDTTSGLHNLSRWVGTSKWDVIHFNWGLWDLCYRHPESKMYGQRDKVNGTIAVPLDQYEKNLEALVLQLKKTGARLIWASTTRVPEGEAGRFTGDEIKYNAAAGRVMARHAVAVDDLHTLTAGFAPSYFVREGDVHYTIEGYARIAEQVAASIKKDGLNE
jgi:lysophospholipase L1-like esterase